MSVRDKGALITWTTGRLDAPPVLLLHDRYLDHDANDALGAQFAPTQRVVSVRSARTQMEMGVTKGYYWHLGPLDQPELSTMGDALSHLERLLLELNRQTGKRIALVGTGEGGSVALLIALVWRELVGGVVSIDGPLATNIADMPLTLASASGLPVLLVERRADLAASHTELTARGASVSTGTVNDETIVRWVEGLPAALPV
jgi:pimeloyl-ACP methyl ester carboxylesterase